MTIVHREIVTQLTIAKVYPTKVESKYCYYSHSVIFGTRNYFVFFAEISTIKAS